MQIQIKRQSPDYPFVWVHVEVSNESRLTPEKVARTDKFLREVGISLLGDWEVAGEHDLRAPALLEDEYIKPPKKRVRKR